MAQQSLLTTSEKEAMLADVAQAIQQVQTEDTNLYNAAKQVMEFYFKTFKNTQKSFRENTNSWYYNYRFSVNTKLQQSNEYLSLKRNKISQKYINDLHILQGYIENFMAQFLGRAITRYAIYYTDNDGVTYRKEFSSEEEKRLYSQKSLQTLRLSPKQKEYIKKEINDAKLQLIFSNHYQNYIIQLEKVYSKMSQQKKYKNILSRQKFNEGIKSEAFERHFQKIHNGNPENITSTQNNFNTKQLQEDLLLSFGFTPWWVQGDVLNLQVKSFSKNSSAVSSGSPRSLEELLNFINLIYNKQLYNSIEIETIAKTVVRGLMDESFDNKLEQTLQKLLSNFDKS